MPNKTHALKAAIYLTHLAESLAKQQGIALEGPMFYVQNEFGHNVSEAQDEPNVAANHSRPHRCYYIRGQFSFSGEVHNQLEGRQPETGQRHYTINQQILAYKAFEDHFLHEVHTVAPTLEDKMLTPTDAMEHRFSYKIAPSMVEFSDRKKAFEDLAAQYDRQIAPLLAHAEEDISLGDVSTMLTPGTAERLVQVGARWQQQQEEQTARGSLQAREQQDWVELVSKHIGQSQVRRG